MAELSGANNGRAGLPPLHVPFFYACRSTLTAAARANTHSNQHQEVRQAAADFQKRDTGMFKGYAAMGLAALVCIAIIVAARNWSCRSTEG